MNRLNCVLNCSIRGDIQRMVEPLANYICATEQPKAVLISALTVLLREIAATNRAALAHSRTYSENN
jgi:hypothetical protein